MSHFRADLQLGACHHQLNASEKKGWSEVALRSGSNLLLLDLLRHNSSAAVEPRSSPCSIAEYVDTKPNWIVCIRDVPLTWNSIFPHTLSFCFRYNSMSFTSPDVRKVRLTYFDAGDKVQVLNAVIYPDPSLDMPLLGIDLISFGGKHLAGIDFQPLYDDEKCRSR